MKSEFFKSTALWVIDYHYEGRPRRLFKPYAVQADVPALAADELQQLFGSKARLEAARPATDEEERQWLRDEQPRNVLCPTGRHA